MQSFSCETRLFVRVKKWHRIAPPAVCGLSHIARPSPGDPRSLQKEASFFPEAHEWQGNCHYRVLH